MSYSNPGIQPEPTFTTYTKTTNGVVFGVGSFAAAETFASGAIVYEQQKIVVAYASNSSFWFTVSFDGTVFNKPKPGSISTVPTGFQPTNSILGRYTLFPDNAGNPFVLDAVTGNLIQALAIPTHSGLSGGMAPSGRFCAWIGRNGVTAGLLTMYQGS